jgi:hypothetical protein
VVSYAFADFARDDSDDVTIGYALAGFFEVFGLRPRRGYKRLASSTLMTLIDICCSLGFKFATFVAASALVDNQCGTVNCPHLVGTAACAGRS